MIDPNLFYGISYWKDYKINDEDLDFDGNDRLEFQSSVGKINNISFINLSLVESCPSGSSIRAIYENGSVVCELDDSAGSPDLTNYALTNESEVFQGNITTAHTGFFNLLGDLISRINNLFVEDINFNGTITGTGNITTTGNVTADYFMGDGSLLTGISTSSYDDSWINETIYNTTDVNEINTSMKNYVDDVATDTDTFVANYSQFITNNESLTNYIASNNASVENYILYVNSTNGAGSGTDTFVANYSQFITNNESLTNYIASNNASIENYILTLSFADNDTLVNYIAEVNTSMKNYVDTQNTSISNTLGLYALISTLVDRLGNWSAEKANYYTSTQVDDINTSMKNYVDDVATDTDTFVANYSQFLTNNESLTDYIASNNVSVENYILYVNSTNAGTDTDTDTFVANYSQFLINNESLTNYIASNNASIENYILTLEFADNDTLVNYIAEVNTSMKNYVDGTFTTETYVDTQNTSVTNYIDSLEFADNDTLVNYIAEVNTSISNTLGLYALISTLIDRLGNWSADKDNYYTSTQVDTINTSMKNYVDEVATDTDTFVANYSQFLTNNQSLTNYIASNNVSVENYILYVNSTNTGLDTDTDTFVTNYSQFLTNNESLTNYIASNNASIENYILTLGFADNDTLVNYIAEVNTSMKNYVDGTFTTENYVDTQNTSMKNYVDSQPSYEDSWINTTVDSKIETNNQSISNTLGLYALISTLVDRLGNWSADKGDYYTSVEVDDVNTSMKNYVDDVAVDTDTFVANYSQFLLNNVSLTNYLETNNASVENYILYVNSTNTGLDTDTFVANYSQFLLNNQSLTNYIASNNASIENYIIVVNTSMKNYVDDVAVGDANWDATFNATLLIVDTELNDSVVNYITVQNNSILNWISNVFNVTRNNYALLQNNSIVNWVNDIFYTKTEVDDINTSMENYVVEVNTSMKNYVDDVAGDTDTFVANYSTFLTHTTWAEAMNGTLFQTSQWNATNTSYLPLAGGSMTGNLNLSADINLTMNGGNQIGSNVTCVEIKGSSVTMLIC